MGYLHHACVAFPSSLDAISLESLLKSTEYNYEGGGYGKSSAASREAKKLAALDGITLEETYTAKAFAALVDAVRSESAPGKTFLFWQTNSQDNDE